MAKIIRWITIGAVVCAVVCAVVLEVLPPASSVKVAIPPRSSAREIARIFKKSDIIWSETMLLVWAKLSGNIGHFKAGVYLVSPRITIFSLTKRLASGESRLYRTTIPEGFTAEQIADLLARTALADRAKFLQLVRQRQCEGYLFPQTYYLEPYLGEEKIIDLMTAEFHRVVTPAMLEDARRINLTERQLVTLASIVEKEAVKPEERALIAGVFLNRLRKHWYLESCATVQYAMGIHKAKLSIKDTRYDSPYNTYRHFGLPPGPICNPGAASLRAAANPATTEDMFFVASDSGTHLFSQYFRQHVHNKRAVKHGQ
ncbi:MAG: endolytic transglycosylase MltG [Endomicrobiales bacterium]|jgi:UPF0755 protein